MSVITIIVILFLCWYWIYYKSTVHVQCWLKMPSRLLWRTTSQRMKIQMEDRPSHRPS